MAKVNQEVDPRLEALCARISEDLATALPKGFGFSLFLSETKTPGSGGAAFAAGSNIPRDEVVAALYRWIEYVGERGIGAELGPTLRQAIAILRAAGGKGLTARALTPARALAVGAMAGFGFAAHEDDPAEEEIAIAAIAIFEMMIAAEPVADAELAAERAQRRS